jgi:hypothetical protein
MQNDYDIFLDLFGKWCVMAKDGKKDTEEAKVIWDKATVIYDKFTDEEVFNVDEYILRMRLWFGV